MGYYTSSYLEPKGDLKEIKEDKEVNIILDSKILKEEP